MKQNKKLQLVIIGFICLIYIALRFWHLTDSCLWFDEIFSVHAAEHHWKELFWFVAQDLIHPPLFYVFLKIWVFIGGESLFSLRLFPVVFSITAVVPFLLLCRQLKFSFPTNALALAFFAVNGSCIKYAQEVRMYSLLMCLGLFSLWLFARFVNMGKGFPTLVIINVLLVYTHYFGWLIIVSELFARRDFGAASVKDDFVDGRGYFHKFYALDLRRLGSLKDKFKCRTEYRLDGKTGFCLDFSIHFRFVRADLFRAK